MGLEIAAITMAVVATGATIGKAGAEIKSASAKEAALDVQAKQTELQTQQKTLSNYDVMEKVIDAQTAHMTTTGTAFSSPSFNAIQRNTLNIGGRKQRNTEIEGDIAQRNIEFEKQNVKNSLYAQLFGDVAGLAVSVGSIYTKMPALAE